MFVISPAHPPISTTKIAELLLPSVRSSSWTLMMLGAVAERNLAMATLSEPDNSSTPAIVLLIMKHPITLLLRRCIFPTTAFAVGSI
jgi:hypothetical protein